MNLLPTPRSLKRRAGSLILPRQCLVELDPSLNRDDALSVLQRLQTWNDGLAANHGTFAIQARRPGDQRDSNIVAIHNPTLKLSKTLRLNRGQLAELYQLAVSQTGVRIEFATIPGLRAAVATLRQLLREYGRQLPCLRIIDWPAFARRGLMLDVSRGRVPNLATLLNLAERLADFKINELQLYTEHTFAYRDHSSVWRDWGALTAKELRTLDERCLELGIDLVPNQNSFGHLREFLASPKLRHLAETSSPWPDGEGTFWRYPSTVAPNHPGTIRFLRKLYDELLPNFSSEFFNVGCDETWDLGRGQSKRLCERLGKQAVYLDFLKRIHHEVSQRGKRMMFWGDIILNQPGLIRKLPKDVVALNWGYEANHPFMRETKQFARAGVPFYVCPGTSTWATLVGKHETAFANLELAARAGQANGACGYLITEWGDGGHPQPLAVAWLPFIMGASLAWSGKTASTKLLLHGASRDVFHDPAGRVARAALDLGLAHLKLKYKTPNASPLGATIAAPRPEMHELFCREGLKYYARLKPHNVRAVIQELQKHRTGLHRNQTNSAQGKLLAAELDLAARMALQSANIILWQQALAGGRRAEAKRLAKQGIADLRLIERDFNALWPRRNKATSARSIPFLQWRTADYLCARLHFSPEIARKA
jgi:hexosaminidase